MHNNTVFAQLRRRSQKRETPSKRKEKTRNLQVHFLIMCEGKSTEPNYFKNLIKDKRSAILTCKIQGAGKGTIALIEETSRKKCELEKSNSMEFDRVWVVFDKDDFTDFNEAIKQAKKKDFRCAWSNSAFELWYCLHFKKITKHTSSKELCQLLSKLISKKTNKTYKYKKSDEQLFDLLQDKGSEINAINFAKELRNLHKGCDYKNHNPCTTVDILVQELRNPEQLSIT